MNTRIMFPRLRGRRGATIVFVALAMVALLSFAALAVDLGYLYVVRNELQNAADAGALAGAHELYLPDGSAVNPGADAVAVEYVNNNFSEKSPVIVESVQRGHWSFSTRTFEANNSTAAVDIWNFSTKDLDLDPDFINAVQVITRRTEEGGSPRQHFFARIFGAAPSQIRAVAVAYIGFAGTLEPRAVDQPIAMCKDKITVAGQYSCSVGRMLNNNVQTARWTDFTQPEGGQCSAQDSAVNPLICQTGNLETLTFGAPLGTTNGTQGNTITAIEGCWRRNAPDSDGDGNPDGGWPLALPVVNGPCGGGECHNFDLVGAVIVNVLWVVDQNDPQFARVPRRMVNPNTGEEWVCSTMATDKTAGQTCWLEFGQAFDLLNASNQPLTIDDYALKTVYFLPDCDFHEPRGKAGGENFGILAKIPVLVR